MPGVRWTEDQLAELERRRAELPRMVPKRQITAETFPITPLGKPRMTRRDQWKKRPAVLRYRAFCDEVRLHGVSLPPEGAHVTFVIPMPQSWSKRKRAEHEGQPHRQRPDLDNLLKALADAVYDEDCVISDVRASKVWGVEGRVIVQREVRAR